MSHYCWDQLLVDNQLRLSEHCVSQAHVAFAPRGTHQVWVSAGSVLPRKVPGISSPLDLLYQWCHLEVLNPGCALAFKKYTEVSTILKSVFYLLICIFYTYPTCEYLPKQSLLAHFYPLYDWYLFYCHILPATFIL